MASNSDNEINFDATLRQHIKNSGAASVAVCDRFDPDTANAYLEQALTKNALTAYENHLAECAFCRRQIVALSQLLPPVATAAMVAETTPEKSSPTIFAGLAKWFSGWRLGALAGLGAATAALIFVFSAQLAPQQNTVSTDQIAQTKDATPSPLPEISADKFSANKAHELTTTVASPQPTIATAMSKANEQTAGAAALPSTNEPAVTAVPPPPPKPTSAGSSADGASQAVKRDDVAANLPPNQTQNWQPTNQTQMPSGPAVNQMQTDRLIARTEENRERAKQSEPVRGLAKEKAQEIVTSDAARIEPSTENDKQAVAKKEASTVAPARSAAPMAMKSAAAPPTRNVSGKNFRFENGVWVDTEYKADRGLPVVRLQHNSAEFQQTQKNVAALKPYFALQSVTVVWQGKVYEVRK